MIDVRGGAREWRLYVIAAIAGVYVLAFSRIRPTAAPAATPAPARNVWLDELAPDARPALSPPMGWRVADRHEIATATPRRVPTTRATRVRTRSS